MQSMEAQIVGEVGGRNIKIKTEFAEGLNF
jgi:hypothetical protein